MSVNNLKCTECDAVTTDVCSSCGTAPLCESCRESVNVCAACEPEEEDEEEEDFDEDDEDEDDDDGEPVGWDDDDEEGESWPAPERDE